MKYKTRCDTELRPFISTVWRPCRPVFLGMDTTTARRQSIHPEAVVIILWTWWFHDVDMWFSMALSTDKLNCFQQWHQPEIQLDATRGSWVCMPLSTKSQRLPPGETTLACHPGWSYDDILHPAGRHRTVTQLLLRLCLILDKGGDAAFALQSGCHSLNAEKHCTSHWRVASPSFRRPLLKIADPSLGAWPPRSNAYSRQSWESKASIFWESDFWHACSLHFACWQP